MHPFLIIDPTLNSCEGHSYHYDLAIAQAAAARGSAVVLYADRRLPALAHHQPIRRTLNLLPMNTLKALANAVFFALSRLRERGTPPTHHAAHATIAAAVPSRIIRLGERVRAVDLWLSLRAILRSRQAVDAQMFIQHARMSELIAVERSLPTLCGAQRFHLVLRYVPELMHAAYESAADFRARLTRLLASERVVFYTDSDALTASYLSLWENRASDGGLDPQTRAARGSLSLRMTESTFQHSFTTLPIPLFLPAHLLQRNKTPTAHLQLAMLGAPRLEKGFGLAPEILAQLPQTLGGKPTRLAVQINRNSADAESIAVMATLDAATSPVLRLLEGPVDESVYFDWFAETDILLAPYISPKYAASTSGVFVEALFLQVPTIAMANTWMAAQIEAAAARGLRVGAVMHTVADIAPLAEKIAANLAHYQQDLRTLRDAWQHFHTAENLVSMVMESRA